MNEIDPITIRSLAPGDRPQWSNLLVAHGQTYGLDVSTSTIETTWRWIRDAEAPLKGLAAVDQSGKIVGIVHFQLTYRALAGTMSCYLSELHVAAAYRGRGVGFKLVDAVRRVAHAHECGSVRWLGHESNLAARRLYDRFAARTDFVLYEVAAGAQAPAPQPRADRDQVESLRAPT